MRGLGRILAKDAVGIVHVDAESPRNGDISCLGKFHSFLKGVVHPNFRYDDHEGEADGAGVGGGMVAVIVDEVRCRKAEVDEVN